MFATALITPRLGYMICSGPLLAPWRLALRVFGWVSGLLLSWMCWVGATPTGFVPQAKVGCRLGARRNRLPLPRGSLPMGSRHSV